MIDFNVKCPKNYPLKCNLVDTEKEALVRSEKYKGLLMYQFEGQRNYLVPNVKEYFRTPLYYFFDAREESGLGIKSCKICRLALASDFGVASLTPLNNNVFFEVGLMQGLSKPVVYLVDRDFEYKGQKGAKAVPFDLSDQMVIEHENAKELSSKLEKEIPAFIEKVQLSTVYEKEFVGFVKNKLKGLDDDRKKVLKYFVLEQAKEIRHDQIQGLLSAGGFKVTIGIQYALADLAKLGFLNKMNPTLLGPEPLSGGPVYVLEERYRAILKELLFKE